MPQAYVGTSRTFSYTQGKDSWQEQHQRQHRLSVRIAEDQGHERGCCKNDSDCSQSSSRKTVPRCLADHGQKHLPVSPGNRTQKY